MKTESMVKYVLRLALTLLAITAVVAALLAGINSITAPKIEELTAQKTQDAIKIVLLGPDASADAALEYTEIAFNDESSWVSVVYESTEGYAVQVKPTTGFDGEITMMVGVDLEGNVKGISIISHTETAGLGAVAADTTPKGEAFRDQFVGMNGELNVTKDGGTVEAITGATITSRAICDGINAARECVANLG